MPYKTIFGDIFENEFDEEMTRAFPQTYKVLKNIYPDAYKLPKDEIKTMSQMLRSQGETLDEATGLVQSHIKKNEPSWKLDYFDDKPEQDKPSFDSQLDKTLRFIPTYPIGEVLADTKIAYDYWQDMKKSGTKLVQQYGSGKGADIDNYYHPLLQCHLAKISPFSKKTGIALGYAKEAFIDYIPKRIKGESHKNILKDSNKDLKNNAYGSTIGTMYPKRSCVDLLDDQRTRNMKDAKIY